MARLRGRRAQIRDQADCPTSDAGITASTQADGDAFAALYVRHFDGIYFYCLGQLRSGDRAEEATQQIFVQALEAFARYHETGRFRQWLYVIAHNVIVNHRRTSHTLLPLEFVDDVPSNDPSPEALAILATERRDLLEAIARLPDGQRRAITLRLKGKTGKEIATEMERSHEAVRTLLQHAVDRLSIELGGRRGHSKGRGRDN